MSEFTKGPWTLEKVSGFDYGADQYWIPGICTNVRNKHDANLIAAAPDMYEALSALLSRISNDAEAKHWFKLEQSSAVLALATANGQEKGE